MKLFIKLFVIALSVLLVSLPQAYAELTWSANVETNTTVELDSDGTDTTAFSNDGRVEVAVESKTENESGTFVASKGCFEVQVDGTMGVCDVWFQIGNPSWSFKVGHWEAEDLVTEGEDVYIAGTDASQWYKVDKTRGRSPDGAGIVASIGENLNLDAKVTYDGSDGNNQIGFRPVLILTSGDLTVKAGGEYLLTKPQDNDADDEDTWYGAGVDVKIALGNLTIGGSATYGKNEATVVTTDDLGAEIKTETEETVMSDTIYLTMAMGDSTLGLGGGYTMEDEADTNEMYAFVSYAMPLPVDGATVKFAASFASGDNGVDDLTAYGARVRFNYTF